jgi:response regulator NasT
VLTHTVELAVKLSHKFYSIQKQVQSLENKLEERKNVDIARGILMKKLTLTKRRHTEIFKKKPWIRGRTINEIAKTIIKMFEFIDTK